MLAGDEAVWPDFPFSNDTFSPQGSDECLGEALKILYSKINARDKTPGATRLQIKEIAIAFNYMQELERTAPRLKDTLGQLADLREGIEGLLKTWSSTDQMTAHVLNIGIQDFRSAQGLSKKELRSSLMISESGEPQWPAALSGLESCLLRGEELLIGTQGSGDPDKPDLGGNTNLYVRLWGHPKGNFLRSCWAIFEEYRPGEANSSIEGPAAEFARQVYEYATGRWPDDDNAGLERWIKSTARFFKRRDMIFTRIKEVGAQNLQVVEELDSEETTPRTRKILETRQDDLKEEWKSLECKLDDWMGELTAGRIREEQKGRVISMLRRQSSNVSDQSDRPLNCLDE